MYWLYFLKNIKIKLTYRFNVVFGLLATLSALITKIVVWDALYAGKEVVGGVSLGETIFYALASTVVTAVMGSNVGTILGENIQTGIISIDFARPIKLKKWYAVQDMSGIVYELINAVLLAGITFLALGGIDIKIQMMNLFPFLSTFVLGFILNYQINWLLGLTSFWLQTSWHIKWITGALIKTFSGTVLPLWFYPEWMLTISRFLPYRYIFYDPLSILLGKNTEGIFWILGIQSAWIIALFILEKRVWKAAQNKVIVQGG